ncbi:MAG TPA: MBOAT family O-acyltransferase, partial [Planctomycetota bacterium]
MVFNSLVFALFLGIVFGLDRLTPSWTLRKFYLLTASYLFYAAWYPPFLLLLLIPTLSDWFAARFIASTTKPAVRRMILAASLCVNLGLLGFFKYANFLWDTGAAVAQAIGFEAQARHFNVLLPVGISFYTFQTMSYTIDVYRRELMPARSFLDYALYVSFFPQLVSGPILRAGYFLPQCETPRRATGDQIGWGLTLLTIGLFHKVVVADGILAPVADRVFGAQMAVGCAEAWIGSLSFAGQVFFDFAGYSGCAIGTALLLGWHFPDNFRFPFAALGFSDFWRRWHISLSSWLRDYLYVPLGGNRAGPVRRSANLMTTMLLGGLWHGASWKFVVWGGLHGLFLALERAAQSVLGIEGWRRTAAGRFALWAGTFFLISFTWAFFRAPDFSSACGVVESMLSPARGAVLDISLVRMSSVGAVLACLLLLHGFMRDRTAESVWSRMAWPLRSALLAGMILAFVLVPGDSRAF